MQESKTTKRKALSRDKIIDLAIKSGMPPGWYQGPWFDDNDQLRSGPPPCLTKFAKLVRNI